MASRWIFGIPPQGFLALAALLIACGTDEPGPVITDRTASIERFEAAPPALSVPGAVELSWETRHAVSLSLSHDGEAVELGDAPIAAGSIEVQVEETSTFELVASGRNGVEVRSSVRVTVEATTREPPAIATFVGPEAVGRNEEGKAMALLSWTGVEEADELVLEAAGMESILLPLTQTPDGEVEVELEESATFTLVASNASGEASLQHEVRLVELPVIESLKSNRDWAGHSDLVLVEWTTAGAIEVELLVNGASVALVDPTVTNGSAEVAVHFDSVIELRAFNELGQVVSDEVDVRVFAPVVDLFLASATGLWLEETLDLNWRTRGGSSLQVVVEGTNQVVCAAEDLDEVAESSCSWQPGPGTYVLILSVENGSGIATKSWNLRVGSGPAIASFTVTPAEVTLGDQVTFAWVAHPDPMGQVPTLHLTDDRGGEYDLTGSDGSRRISFDRGIGAFEFTLIASTDHPKSVSVEAKASLVAHALPTVTLKATPELFDDSEAADVAIEWTSENAANLILTQTTSAGSTVIEVIPEERRAAGSYRFVPQEPSSFRIDARNAKGALDFAEVQVNVAPPRVSKFVASPTQFDIGDAVELEWEARMASAMEISIFNGAYVAGETRTPFIDASQGGTHLPLAAGCNAAILTEGCAVLDFPDGFRFPYGGGSFTSARVFSNGFVSFATPGTGVSSQNQAFPTAPAHQHVHLAPFWDALTWDSAIFPTGNIHYLLQGSAGNRSLVIQWKGVTFAGTSHRKAKLDFEVVLHEAGGFDFRYGDMDAGLDATQLDIDAAEGRSATIGYQLQDRSSSHMRQHNRSINIWGSISGRSFTYVPRPAVGMSGTFTWHPYPSAETMQVTAKAIRGSLSDERTLSFTASRLPELRIAQRPVAPVEVGTEFRIGWKALYASKVEVRNQGGALLCETAVPQEVAEGSCLRSEAAEGVYTYRVRALDAKGVWTEKSTEAVIYAPFGIDSLELDKEIVEPGENVLVSWATHNATTISLKANGVELLAGTAPASGNLLHRVDANTTFVLRVENDLGVFREESRSIQIFAVGLELTSSATVVRPGETVTIGVNVTPREGQPVPKVFGTFPMAEVLPAPAYQDISALEGATSLKMSDDASGFAEIQFPEGFSFPYFGESFRGMRIFVDGYVSFSDASSHPANEPLPVLDVGQPSTVPRIHLAPFWDDLTLWPGALVSTAMIGTDTFMIQWKGVSSVTGSSAANPYDLNFQIALKRDGEFEYRYGTMAPPAVGNIACRPSSCANEAAGSSATIGYQSPGGVMGLTVHHGGTLSGPGNPTFPGGLSNRAFRYVPFLSGTQVVVRPIRSGTYTFCVQPDSHMLCRSVEVEAEFGIDTFTTDHALITFGGSTTLRWKTHGGTSLRILDGDTEIWSTTVLTEIDEGTRVLSPTANATYTLELTGLSNRAIEVGYVDVVRVDIRGSATPSTTAPGTPVTLSWTATTADQFYEPMIIAPMEEVTGQPFAARDISGLPGIVPLFSGGVATPVRTATFAEGFTFPYFGVPQTSVQISGLGFLSFDPAVTNGPTTNTILPNPAQSRVHLAPFWDQMHLRVSGKVFAAQWDADTYVVQWSNVSVNTGSANTNEYNLNFMVVLHRDGSFEYRYGTMQESPGGHNNCRPITCENEANGSTATIGFQDPTSTYGYVLNFSNTADEQKAVPRGLSNRTWKFTPGALNGSRQVAPWETTPYRICALDLVTKDMTCADTVEVVTRWGIASFDADEYTPLPSTSVRLSWDVIGLENLQLTADGVSLFNEPAGVFQSQGSMIVTPTGPTEYVLEGTSLGRKVQVSRLVEPRTFQLTLTPDKTTILPGDEVTIQWTFTTLGSGGSNFGVPLNEVTGPASSFQDIRSVGTEIFPTGSVATGCATISLPFSFPYFGQNSNQAAVYVDGYLSFDPTCVNGIPANTELPNPGATQTRIHLAPFWDDLHNAPQTSYFTHSPSPDTFIIQWTNVDRLFSGNLAGFDLNFQLVLFSNGAFEYRYGRMAPPPAPFTSNSCYPAPGTCAAEAAGSSATIGYQNVGSTIGFLHHFGGNTAATVVPLEGGVENKALRFDPVSTGSTKIRVGAQPKDFTLCGTVGAFTECKTLTLEPAATAGDLAITELMLDPTGGASEQWFEVRNLTDRTIDLNDFVIRSNSGSSTISAPILLAPRAYILFAATTIPDALVSWSWGTSLSLNKASDTLTLSAGTATIASVEWNNDWTIPAGRTLSLDGSYHWTGSVSNDSFNRWCLDRGSPGHLGEGCRYRDYDLDPSASGTFYDISQTGTRLYNLDNAGQISHVRLHGLEWPFYGQRYSSFWVSGNGWLSFSEEFPDGANQGAPGLIIGSDFPRNSTALPKGPLIGGFWDNLRCLREQRDCSVTYQRGIFGGEEAVIVQWTRQQRGTATSAPTPGEITFQIQLWENGDIAVVFGDVYSPDAPGSATWAFYQGGQAWVGIESHNLTDFVTAHSRKNASFGNRTIRYSAK